MPGLKSRKRPTAVITGASSGVGRAIAVVLASRGYSVVLIARRRRELESTRKACLRAGGEAAVHAADLSSDADLLAAADAAAPGGVDVLVHAAGSFGFGTVATAPVEDLDRLYRCNLRAPYLLTQRLLPAVIRRKGQIVFINSTVGVQSRGSVAQYAATKHGLKALADALREEVNPAGVRVLSVFLGRTATPMQEAVRAAEGKPYRAAEYLDPRQVAKTVADALATGRSSQVSDLRILPATPAT